MFTSRLKAFVSFAWAQFVAFKACLSQPSRQSLTHPSRCPTRTAMCTARPPAKFVRARPTATPRRETSTAYLTASPVPSWPARQCQGPWVATARCIDMTFDYSVPSIDNPPVMGVHDDESSIGRAVRLLSEGHRIPMDVAQDLMDQGIDVPSLSRSYE